MNKIKLALVFTIFFSASLYPQSGWTTILIDTSYNLHLLSFRDSLIGFAAGNLTNYRYGGKVYKTINGGNSWYYVAGSYKGMISMHFINSTSGFIITDERNYFPRRKTTDGGSSWLSIGVSYPPNVHNIIYFIDGNSGYVIGNSDKLKTTNGGVNWTNAVFGYVNQVFSINFINLNTGFIAGFNVSANSNCIAKTTDQGTSWTYFNITPSAKKIVFADSSTGFGVCSNGQVIKTSNGGDNWSFVSLPVTLTLQSISFPNENTGYVLTTNSIVFKTTNGCQTWSQQQLPSGNAVPYEIAFASPTRGLVSCSAGIIYRTTTGGEPLGIKRINSTVPDKFYLSQNFPNPFNPYTQIRFGIPASGGELVRLRIYDVLGREIGHLINEKLDAGEYSVEWNAVNLPSGIYYYQIVTEDFSETKKMILIK